ncbi:MAG: hypothetical protein RBT34_11435 [Anaerolineaceae bacterium]|jgi:hypothetical protein|nr:hypothetical protein [Anaerolineaceae bacterium]
MKSDTWIWISRPQKTSEGQCDCACSQIQVDMDLRVNEICEEDIFQINSQLHFWPLDVSHVLVFHPSSGHNIVVIDSTVRDFLEQFKGPTKLETVFSNDLTEQQMNDLLEEMIVLGFLCPVSE